MACLARWSTRAGLLIRYLSECQPPSSLPSAPTTCCMSGCANCVWIDYAEKLISQYGNCPNSVMKDVLAQVDDPSLKAFLEMELMFRLKK